MLINDQRGLKNPVNFKHLKCGSFFFSSVKTNKLRLKVSNNAAFDCIEHVLNDWNEDCEVYVVDGEITIK
jgi:hypothetical protein